MIIFGMRWITWGNSERLNRETFCTRCGQTSSFIKRTRMRFIHIFWIPLIPTSGKQDVYKCPTCGAMYDHVG